MSDTPTPPAEPTSEAPPAQSASQAAPSPTPADMEGVDYKALAEKAEAEKEKWRSLARKHEERAKANADAASKSKTVEEQLEEMRKTLAERDVADVQRNGRLAVTQVQAKLAESGFNQADVAGLLELIDPVTLLKDGEPDESAIKKLAESLIKVGGRTTPDRDQGQRGGGNPLDMNALIRRRAGVGR